MIVVYHFLGFFGQFLIGTLVYPDDIRPRTQGHLGDIFHNFMHFKDRHRRPDLKSAIEYPSVQCNVNFGHRHADRRCT